MRALRGASISGNAYLAVFVLKPSGYVDPRVGLAKNACRDPVFAWRPGICGSIGELRCESKCVGDRFGEDEVLGDPMEWRWRGSGFIRAPVRLWRDGCARMGLNGVSWSSSSRSCMGSCTGTGTTDGR